MSDNLQTVVRPAACIVGHHSWSIKQAVTTMKSRTSSYIVILDSDKNICGIVTAADIIKNIDLVATGAYWSKAISTIMSRNVHTLRSANMHLAAKIMVEKNIRHLPVCLVREGQPPKILGMITSDVIFKSMVKKSGPPLILGSDSEKRTSKNIGVLSTNGESFDALTRMVSHNSSLSVNRLFLKDLQDDRHIESAAVHNDMIVLDIDEIPYQSWVKVLRFFNTHPHLESVCLFYDQALHAESITELLDKLTGVGWLNIYRKPLDLSHFIVEIENLWE